jgi:hypothetical protein
MFLPVAKLSITPIHKVDATAASTALPPFFKTIKKIYKYGCGWHDKYIITVNPNIGA